MGSILMTVLGRGDGIEMAVESVGGTCCTHHLVVMEVLRGTPGEWVASGG